MSRSIRLTAIVGVAAVALGALAVAAPARQATAATEAPDASVGKVLGYFAEWGVYQRNYHVKNIDTSGSASKLTHINYSFGNVTGGGCALGDAEAATSKFYDAASSVDGVADSWDNGALRGNFNQLKKLKAKNPNLKVLISLGGWTYSKYFSDVAATAASRQKFVASCIDTYLKGNVKAYGGAGGPGTAAGIFDGIDIDWEWPGSPDGHPGNHWSANDKTNLTALLAEFRTQMDAYGATTGKRYELQAFTPADPAKVSGGWEIPKIFDYLDVANVQGYDFHGSGSDNSWEPNRTGHQGNLYADADDPYNFKFSVESAINAYTNAGANPRKLTLGLAFYGRGWQGVADGTKKGEWQSATGAAPGQFPEEAGTRGYANLLASVPNCTVQHDTAAVATACYTGNGGQWWTFDDAWSIQQKIAWLKTRGLLGVMAWEMSGDTGTLMTTVDNSLK